MVHPFVRSFITGATAFLVRCLEGILRFELPSGNIAPYFKLSWLLGLHKREVVALYRRLLRPGNIVVDVGAHAGYHTLRFASLVGPSGKVFAFEPSPKTFQVLKKNVIRRRLTNVVLEQKAVADQIGECQLYVFSQHSTGKWGASDSLVAYSDEQVAVTVPCITLDEYFCRVGVIPTLVKIDVEGAEPLVFNGMRTSLSHAQNIALIMEFYPKLISCLGFDPAKFLHTMVREGFELFEIRRNGSLVSIPRDSIDAFARQVVKLTNILAIKGQWER